MKKRIARLKLAKESLLRLDSMELSKVDGAYPPTLYNLTCRSCEYECPTLSMYPGYCCPTVSD